MTTTYNKRRIFKTAWQIKRRNSSVSFSECLSIAWGRAKSDMYEVRKAEAQRKERANEEFVPLTSISNYVGGIESYYSSGAYSGD